MHFTTRRRWSTPSFAAFGTKRNDTLWEGDVFELFFKPNSANARLFRVSGESAHGRVRDGLSEAWGRPFAFTKAPLLGSKAVVELKGTLDQPGDRDLGWSVEGRIPWTAFAPAGGKTEPRRRVALCALPL